jgi:hypothetical protein
MVVLDPTMCSKSLPPTEEAMLQANLGLGFSELNINLSGTNAHRVEIHALIVKLTAASRVTNV